MQTFLPVSSFYETAKLLDYRRLGKQRVEAKQILLALERGSGGWINHPAVRMWRGYEDALASYGYRMSKEWINRGYKDTLLPFFAERIDMPFCLPPWIDDDAFNLSHQSNLVRKDPEYYRRFFPDVPDDLPYVWPV